MTSSRVNLRVPPRLIESARAAQYANRETFGARNALDRMAKEVDRRVEAEQRAAPGRDPQRGGLLDFEKRRIPRPKLRRRWRPVVDVGTGWFINDEFSPGLGRELMSSSFNTNNPPLGPEPPSFWGGPFEGGILIPSPQFKSRVSTYTQKWRLYIGSGDGSKWETVFLQASERQEFNISMQYVYTADSTGPFAYTAGSWSAKSTVPQLEWWHLPLGGDRIIFLLTLSQKDGAINGTFEWSGGYADGSPVYTSPNTSSTQDIESVGFVITQTDVTRINLSQIPDFIRGNEPISYEDNIGPFGEFGIALAKPRSPFDGFSSIGASFNACTSAVYDQIMRYPDEEMTPTQANDLYRSFSGRDIPVLGYERTSTGSPNPTTEAGTFGEIIGATVLGAPGSGVLDRTLERKPSTDAQVPVPYPPYELITYDYHGGSYCRDRLADLGLTL
jgi:hypothetical protein